MPMSEDQLKIAQEHVRTKITQPCSACGSRTWSIDDELFAALATQDGRINLGAGASGLTCFVVYCETCKHIDLYSAKKMGLI